MDRNSHRWSRAAAIVLAVAVAALVALTSTASAATGPERGFSLHPNWWQAPPLGATDAELDREIQAAHSLHADVVRVGLPWHLLEPSRAGSWSALASRVDGIMSELAANQMHAVVMVFGTPCWASAAPTLCTPFDPAYALAPPADPNDFGRAVGRMIDRWRSQIDAVEIWNEPNNPANFKGSPAQYVSLVHATRTALDARSWGGQLLAGALGMNATPSGLDWLKQLYAAGLSGEDAISIHPYDIYYDAGGIHYGDPLRPGSLFARHIDGVRSLMRSQGQAPLGIWLTELGASICPATPMCVDEATQSRWLQGMFAAAERRPFVRGSLAYSLRDQSSTDLTADFHFGVLRNDFSERPSAVALRSAFSTPPVQTDPSERMLTVSNEGGGRVTSSPTTIDCGTTCSEKLDDGMEVTLSATPATGYAFAGWSGCPSADGNSCVIEVSGDVSVSARFVPLRRLVVQRSGPGTVTGSPGGISCGLTCGTKVNDGTTVTLTATAPSGYAFTGWSGCDSSAGATCTVAMGSDRTVGATFTQQYTVDVRKSGSGTVTGNGGALSCGQVCSTVVSASSQVTLRAVAATGYEFAGWSGCDQAVGAYCNVWPSSDRSITATFNPIRTLTVQKSGQGTVTSATAGIDCGQSCTTTAAPGTQVTLTAVPAADYVFTGWSGCPASSGSQCTVTLDSDTTVSATFAPQRTVTVQTSGEGTVTSDAGVDCGSTCSATVVGIAQVVLVATPSPGHAFASWAGCDQVSGRWCSVWTGADRNVSARFVATYDLTVGSSGGGTVSGDAGGIDCGASCSTTQPAGTVLNLTASPNPGYTFTGWNDCPSANGPKCSVTLGSNMRVSAGFVANHSLTVQPSGGGTVTSDSGGIDCGASCSTTQPDGTVVNLTASPDPGYAFTGWSNCPSASGANCSVTLGTDTQVSADFTAQHTLTVRGDPNGTVDAGADIQCGPQCRATKLDGTKVTLHAVPAHGFTFGSWSGCESTSGDRCTVTMTGDRTVVPTFAPIAAPETHIRKLKLVRASRRAVVAVTGYGGTGQLSLSCTLDGAPSPCSRHLVMRLSPGRHILRATAVDELGRADPTPALLRLRMANNR